ncbi:MAG: YlxR family protein [Chloroflexi bacterium]|nr:MAG: YlxR family protein [Chloroflexota bacterium]
MPKRRPDHQPQRTCAVCRTVHSKREMQRVVRTADGAAVVDASGRLPGRGTYLCSDPDCQANPAREKAIARALGIGVTLATA